MKTAIICASTHLQKTNRLVKSIVKNVSDVTLIDVSKADQSDLSTFDVIGMSYGYFSERITKSVVNFIDNNLPEQKKFFFMYNCGSEAPKCLQKITESVINKNPNVIGAFNCYSNSPFGFLHEKEINRAVQFVETLA